MKMYLVIGDWSQDGHNQYNKILVEVNKNVSEVQNAYKNSCKLTGITFDSNDNFTGITNPTAIASDYEDYELSEKAIEILKKFNCPQELLDCYNEEPSIDTFIELWFWFVKLNIKDLKFTIVKDNIPCINGFWNKNLNSSFGYGLYL